MTGLPMNCFEIFFNFFTGSSIQTTSNHPIHLFQDPPHPNARIIFFHDIDWGRKQTHTSSWMSSSDPEECWPETWLTKRYQDAQIVSTCYDAGIWKKSTTGRMDLRRLGENLRQDIMPLIFNNECPIFLVGHGLGGLVIKVLIRDMQEKRDSLHRRKASHHSYNRDISKLDCFLENVKGFLFYNTPFLGSRLVGWTKCIPCKGLLLGPLKVLSTQACLANQWFMEWRNGRQDCKVKMIHAVLPTQVGLWYAKVVEEGSARHDIDDFYSFPSDHFNVCRPTDENDMRFKYLTELIDLHMPETTRRMPPPPIEDRGKSACIQSMTDIQLKLEEVGRIGLMVDKCVLMEIKRFPDVWDSLTDAQKNSGFEKTNDFPNSEFWERVDEQGYV
ncbi:unnamed protein product [Calypogeia fissa]